MTMLDQFRPDPACGPFDRPIEDDKKKFDRTVYEPGFYNAEIRSASLHDKYIMIKFKLLDFDGAEIPKFINLNQDEKGLKYTRQWLTILMRNCTDTKEFKDLYTYWESHPVHDAFNKLANRKLKVEIVQWSNQGKTGNDIKKTYSYNYEIPVMENKKAQTPAGHEINDEIMF